MYFNVHWRLAKINMSDKGYEVSHESIEKIHNWGYNMFKNKKFAKHGITFMVIGFIYNFFFTGLMTDHMNILTPYMIANYGWDDLKITNPTTIGAALVIVVYLVIGTAFLKFGIKKIVIPTILVLALSCAGVALAGDNYSIYFVSLLLIRMLVVPLQMGSFMLAANWFIKYRGRVLGLITAGSPLFSIIGIGFLTVLVSAIGLNAYLVLSVMLLATAVFTYFGIKDTPEELGLFPDGSDKAPLSEESHEDIEAISLKEILTDKRAWQLIISYGILFFVIVGSMGYMAVRYISLSGPNDTPNLFVSKAIIWLAVGAAAGIPMSYVLGFIDDKFGSIKASLLLVALFLFAIIPLAIMPVGGNVPLMIVWAFGVACMTGGMPTMHPCVTSYVYGRKRYMAANKWIMTMQAIPTAFVYPFMGALNQSGNLTMAYYIMIGLLAIAFVTILSMSKIPDANAADRDYGLKVVDAQELTT